MRVVNLELFHEGDIVRQMHALGDLENADEQPLLRGLLRRERVCHARCAKGSATHGVPVLCARGLTC
jgi:hypothetical protein